MLKKSQRTLVALFAAVLFSTPLAVSTQPVNAQIKDFLDQGARQTDESGAETPPEESVNNIITTVINVLSLVIGVIAVIMIIIGGFKYITSSGDAGNVTSAKNTILYAVVGLVVVALAQIIVRFVIGRVTDPAGSGGAPAP